VLAEKLIEKLSPDETIRRRGPSPSFDELRMGQAVSPAGRGGKASPTLP